jgi:hypothetical protein
MAQGIAMTTTDHDQDMGTIQLLADIPGLASLVETAVKSG